MTTVEKLLVQIFERKKWIIEQVKQQTELYNQHLASKLIIDGFTPPSWLWSPNNSPDSKELNKEELISKLLRPNVKPSVCCSSAHYPMYNNLGHTLDNGENSDGFFMEALTSNKGLNNHGDPIVPTMSGDDATCALNTVSELDVSITSPEDDTDGRNSNICRASDHTLARIQRSKSRQKDLEFRSSAKALAKSGSSHENIDGAFSSRIILSSFATDQTAQKNELPGSAERCVVGESCKDPDVGESNFQSKEKRMDVYTGRITRSRSYVKGPDSVAGSLKIGCSADYCGEDVSSHGAKVSKSRSVSISDYADESRKSAGPAIACFESCEGKALDRADCQGKVSEINIYTGRVSRSKLSSKHRGFADDLSKADTSHDNAQKIDNAIMGPEDDLPAHHVDVSMSRNSPSERCGTSDYWKADSSSNDALGVDNVMMESQDNLPADHVDRSVTRVNPSEVLDEGSGARKSIPEDCKSQKEMGAILSYGMTTSWSSSQHNACVGETPDQDIPPYSVKSGGIILLPSNGRSALQAYISDEELSLIRPSFGPVHQVTGPQTLDNDQDILNSVKFPEISHCVGNMSTTDPKNKFVANDKLPNASGAQSIPPFYETHSRLDEQGDTEAGFVVGNELVLHDLVDQFVSSSSKDFKQRRNLEPPIELGPSSSFVFVEPKELDFGLYEKYNLENSTCNSGKESLDNFSENMSSSFPDSPDKEMSGDIKVPRVEKSSEISDVLSKGEEIWTNSLPYDVQENLDTRTEKYVPIASEHKISKSPLGYTEAGLNCKNYEAEDKADILLTKIVGTPDLQIHFKQGHDSLPEQHIEEGDWSGEGKERGSLVSNAPGSKTDRSPYSFNSVKKPVAESHVCLTEKVEMGSSTCIHDKTKQVSTQEFQVLPCLNGEVSCQYADFPLSENVLVTIGTEGSPQVEDLSLEKKFRTSSIESWPQPKRRKLEHQQANSCTTSPNFRIRKLHSFQSGPTSKHLQSLDMDVDTVLRDASEEKESSDMDMHQVMDFNLTKGLGSTFESQIGEVPFVKEQIEEKKSSTVISNEQLGVALVSSLSNKEAINSHGCSFEGMRTSPSSSNHFDASDPGDRQCSQPSCYLDKRIDYINFENSTLTNRMLQGTKSSQWEDGLQSQCLLLSDSNKDLDFIAVDQSMPVFEGFIVDAQENSGEMDIAAYGVDLDKLNLPSDTIERASILAKICRSASLETPLSSSASAFDFQGTQNLFQSVPNGRTEHLDLSSTLPLDAEVDTQLGFGDSLVNDAKDAIERMQYSDCLPYSGACYGWNFRNRNASPVGKLWERLSLHTESSEKSLSSNPELACFTIEEDSCSTSEENKEMDGTADDALKEFDYVSANHFDKRPPLMDMTNLDLLPPASVSAQEDILRADGLDFVSTKSIVNAAKDKVRQSSKNQFRNYETRKKQTSFLGNSEVRKNQTLSIGGNGIKKSKESILNRSSKAIMPTKSSLIRQEQKLSLKESRTNNIVSNVNSFLPLVQQKQAAPICAGKRDVKVKALEAAEAAKRLEDKKENERKIRKEALKLERAKLEEKNLRQMELEKKKKVEDRKKKDADIIAKKRLREEEERKGKEQKRMRIEAKQQQREQEEKTRAEKAEKEKQRSKDEQMNSKKEYNETKKQQKREIVRGNDDAALKKSETKPNPTGLSVHFEERGTSGDSFEAGKGMHIADKSPTNKDLIPQKIQGNSYEISPYQCSDDEDEEDDALPTKKSIPSWASKSSVALLLPLLQNMNPDAIFPPESSCSMDEVLLHWKL
ncbi:hypothetical protein ACJIZ3_013013 [Penstemon smallii]|uniref:Inner centromere protein ARK-binding domain-containing protein n=1 Tax=Penstemon smallii TaxID=265156 RepID=A0ABD3UQT1_9LAMI